MQKPKTYVAIILDKSGSMVTTKDAAISGFNEQIQQLKEDAKTQDILCSLITFNGEVFEHLWNVPAEELTEADVSNFKPSGATSMIDAVGYTVQKMLNTTDHEDPNSAYLIITITDGQTNQDKHYNWDSLKELTQSCEATKKWTFTYMGCSVDYLEQLSIMTGTAKSNMAAWSNKTNRETNLGFANMRSKQTKYFAERMLNQTSSSSYCASSNTVANFAQEVVEEAPTPVIVNIADLPQVDLSSILDRQPKYLNETVSKISDEIFSNSLQVKWAVDPIPS